ncbi:hypothetical protein K1T71_007055 [Dendrolimus kikuchii]|uniref:Uncharacterized protein n=1 Tax=Dendrolimus kikuchii TaxID=765133 RepID=A0ACC1CZB8_9NEOP|nr:hypothetical protein K1T71_007055 [Dendrolimus kikuchii]
METGSLAASLKLPFQDLILKGANMLSLNKRILKTFSKAKIQRYRRVTVTVGVVRRRERAPSSTPPAPLRTRFKRVANALHVFRGDRGGVIALGLAREGCYVSHFTDISAIDRIHTTVNWLS